MSRKHLTLKMCNETLILLCIKVDKRGNNSRNGLIDYLLFYVPFKNFSLLWRHNHCRWRAAKFRLMLGARAFEQLGIFIVPHLLWHGRSNLGFSCLIRPIQSLLSTCMEMRRTYSNPDPQEVKEQKLSLDRSNTIQLFALSSASFSWSSIYSIYVQKFVIEFETVWLINWFWRKDFKIFPLIIII
jgi:hypothetical protein